MDSGRRRRLMTDRARRKLGLGGFEALETRQVLSYSALGYSLPDLAVIGFAGPSATYGGKIGVTAQVTNLGASSIVEPLAQKPGSPSTADAGPSTVNVYISPTKKITGSSILIGQLDVPALTQNNTIQVSATLTLPTKPPTYPGLGRNAYILFVADATQRVGEIDETNNVSAPVAVKITPNLPDLVTYALDIPPTIQPGDTIQPNIRIANVGSADTAAQGPVTVLLVASLDKKFSVGDSIIGRYTIDNIPASAGTPTKNFVLGDANLTPPPYVRTIDGINATVPLKPGKYYIGVVIDPNNTIRELSEYGKPGSAHTKIDFAQLVQTIPGLPTANVIAPPVSTGFPFPIAATSEGTTPGLPNPPPILANSVRVATAATSTTSTAGPGGEATPTTGKRQFFAILGSTRKRALPTSDNTGSSLVTTPNYIAGGSTVNANDLLQTGPKSLLVTPPPLSSRAGPLTFASTTN